MTEDNKQLWIEQILQRLPNYFTVFYMHVTVHRNKFLFK